MPQETKELARVLSLALLFSGVSLTAQEKAAVTGVVRDSHGLPQAGVVVELLGPAVVGTALTDIHGHYLIKSVLPGVYQMRASAALYLPALQRQLRLRGGMQPVVNLTMSALFDDAAWLSQQRQSTSATIDDWKWTLRSPANRPMLRLADDESPWGSEQATAHGETHGSFTTSMNSGSFGVDGAGGTLLLAHRMADGKRTIWTRGSARSRAPGVTSPVNLVAGVNVNAGPSFQRRVSGRLRTFPQIVGADGSGLKEIAFASAQRTELGDLASLEVGSETQVLSAETTTVVSHPFVRLTSRPVAGWTAGYALASAPQLAQMDAIDREENSAPVAIKTGSKLLAEASLHQEIGLRRGVGRAKVQISYHVDQQRRTALSGALTRFQGSETVSGAGLTLDRSSGDFRVFAPAFQANGCGVLVDMPLGSVITLSGAYLNDVGVTVAANAHSADSLRTKAQRSQALLFAVNAKLPTTGTIVTASYRAQQRRVISVLSPYTAADTAPYFDLHVRQALPRAGSRFSGIEITIDGDNLLSEGYQRSSINGDAAILASALREFRAGLALTF